LLKQRTVLRNTAEWIALLEQAGVPCGPINTLADVFADPQVVARRLKIEMPHPEAGNVPLVARPIRLPETPVEDRNAAPGLGEHREEVLGRLLGRGQGEVVALREGKII